MAKSIFRYLRGELNGYYLTNIYRSIDNEVKDIKKFFRQFKSQQFQSDTMEAQTIFNLGRFASIFLPRKPTTESLTSVYMSDSEIVDGVEYSERGLFNKESEKFDFANTAPNPSADINTLATNTRRSSLVGDENPIGFIDEKTDELFDDNGNVKPSKISATPPTDRAYTDFYGNKFLFLADNITTYENLSASLYYELFKALQSIRYNGVSLESLCNVILVLCPNGLVTIDTIEAEEKGRVLYVYYKYNTEVEVTKKEQRVSLLEYIVQIKFKQVILVERGKEE